MTTSPLAVLRTVIEFAVRFVTSRSPSLMVSLTFTRTSVAFPFAMGEGHGSSDKTLAFPVDTGSGTSSPSSPENSAGSPQEGPLPSHPGARPRSGKIDPGPWGALSFWRFRSDGCAVAAVLVWRGRVHSQGSGISIVSGPPTPFLRPSGSIGISFHDRHQSLSGIACLDTMNARHQIGTMIEVAALGPPFPLHPGRRTASGMNRSRSLGSLAPEGIGRPHTRAIARDRTRSPSIWNAAR